MERCQSFVTPPSLLSFGLTLGVEVTLLLAYTAGAYFVILYNLTLILTVALFVMYTVAPLLYRLASSTYYNLSLRSASFYGLLFGASPISNFNLVGL